MTVVFKDETGRVCRREFPDAHAAFAAVELLLFLEPYRKVTQFLLNLCLQP